MRQHTPAHAAYASHRRGSHIAAPTPAACTYSRQHLSLLFVSLSFVFQEHKAHVQLKLTSLIKRLSFLFIFFFFFLSRTQGTRLAQTNQSHIWVLLFLFFSLYVFLFFLLFFLLACLNSHLGFFSSSTRSTESFCSTHTHTRTHTHVHIHMYTRSRLSVPI